MPDSQLNDAMKTALTKEGYQGSLNGQLVQWLSFEGATGDDIMGLWRSFFNIKAVPDGQHNERYQLWLTIEGFDRTTLMDSELAYWRNRALLP